MSKLLSGSEKKRLLVVERDELLGKSLVGFLQSNGYQTGLLPDGGGIPRKMERNSFHLVVLNTGLPGEDSLYWIKWLRSYYPCIPIIITSANIMPEDRLQSLEAGARDYVIKPFLGGELLIKIRFLLEKDIHGLIPSTIIRIGSFSLDVANKCVFKSGESIPLTQLECKILQLLYMNAGIPLSREDLMWQTMGIRYMPSNRSIDTHINRLRKKIEDAPAKPVYIHTLRGRGYCLHLPEAGDGGQGEDGN